MDEPKHLQPPVFTARPGDSSADSELKHHSGLIMFRTGSAMSVMKQNSEAGDFWGHFAADLDKEAAVGIFSNPFHRHVTVKSSVASADARINGAEHFDTMQFS